jgi:26S proteasome subunit P45 family
VAVVGVLTDDTDPSVSVMKLDKAPTESYADIGGLENQIQEVREAVELPLLHPELYEEMGIKPPKGVILYGAPGTGKTLLAKAVANSTSATFLRIVGSELIQKYLGDGPRLVRQLFQVAAEHAPSIVFIDEIDAIGTKRYESTSGGEREIQRTMLELLNQLDGFDDRGDVKVIMATNKIETLDPALIRPGRIDRKILFENPDRESTYLFFARLTLRRDDEEEDLHATHVEDVAERGRRPGRVHQPEGRSLGRGHQGHLLGGGADGAARAADAGANGRLPDCAGAGAEDEERGRAGGAVSLSAVAYSPIDNRHACRHPLFSASSKQ